MSFNQTNVELKQVLIGSSAKLIEAFNQTNVELKREQGGLDIGFPDTFNQTNVELKLGEDQHSYLLDKLLIRPTWN